MKKILSIILISLLCATSVFAENQGDEYDDGYEYKTNGAGDQMMKMEINGFFPVNFGKQLKPGAGATLTYLQFISDDFAIGGGLSLLTCLSIGNKSFIQIPITLSAMYEPTIGKFEFPIELSVGAAVHTMASHTFFPALVVKGSAGVYYRITETWSVGASGTYIYSPEWFKDSSKNFNGMFALAGLDVRFHF